VKFRQRAESLGHHQRRVVGQHDPARADADRAGAGRNMRDHHSCRGAGDPRHVVVFRQPEAVVPELLGMARQIEAVLQRLPDG